MPPLYEPFPRFTQKSLSLMYKDQVRPGGRADILLDLLHVP